VGEMKEDQGAEEEETTVAQHLCWAEQSSELAIRYAYKAEFAAAIEELAAGIFHLTSAQGMSARQGENSRSEVEGEGRQPGPVRDAP